MRDPQNGRGDGAPGAARRRRSRRRRRRRPGRLAGPRPPTRSCSRSRGNGQTKTFTMAELQALPALQRLVRLRQQRRHGLSARDGHGRQARGRPCVDRRHDHAQRVRRDRVGRLRHDLHLRPGRQQERRPALQRDHQGARGRQGPVDLRHRLGAERRAAAQRRRPAAPRRRPGDQRQPDRRRPPHGQVGQQRRPCAGRSPSGRSRCSASSARTARARRTPWTASPTIRARLPAATASRGSTPPPARRGAACRCSSASARWTAAPVTTATAPTTRRSRSRATASSWSRPTASTRSSAHARSATATSILLANKTMGSDLTAQYYPLRLVGPVKYVPGSKSIGRISKIYLLPK